MKRRLLLGVVDKNLERFLGHLFADRAEEVQIPIGTHWHEHEGSLLVTPGQLSWSVATSDDLPENLWLEEIPNAAQG